MKLRSHCPINFALEHFGDKWSLLIIRDLMFKNKRYYNEFFSADEKISTSVLGDRLKSLEKSGIITKSVDHVKKSRIKYSLTEMGKSLIPTMIEMILWSAKFDRDTGTPDEFIQKTITDREKLISEIYKSLE
ncbi:MAG: helix-turn-helix domain-containing protein [Allomuricauda sp.]